MVIGIEVTIAAVVYVLFSVSVQRKLVNTKEVMVKQNVIKEKSKELNELVKSKASQEAMMAKQKEITSLLGESMRSQLKPMFVILPIFFLFYYLVFPAVFPTNPNIHFLSMTLNYKSYFVLVAFVAGIVVSGVLMLNDRIKIAKEKKQEQTATT